MRRLLWIPICFVALLIPVVVLAGGGEGGFNGVVNTLESRQKASGVPTDRSSSVGWHAHATRIPFLGLISLVSRKATHGGVGALHVAEFDNFTAEVDGNELNKIVEQQLGSSWERIIRETNRHGGEQTLIFIHPEGQRMGLFVLDKDGSEMHVVQVSIDPNRLDDDILHYSHHHHSDRDVSD